MAKIDEDAAAEALLAQAVGAPTPIEAGFAGFKQGLGELPAGAARGFANTVPQVAGEVLDPTRALGPPPAPAAAMTPAGLSALADIVGRNQDLSRQAAQVVTTAPTPAELAIGDPRRLTVKPRGGKTAALAKAGAPADAVEAGLASEMGPEQRALELKPAISGVHDAATDAKRAEDARQAKEEQDALAALDAEKQARLAAQPTWLGNFASRLARGKDMEHPELMTPLEELAKKREMLGQIQKEREGREEKARSTALTDPGSDLTKTSAAALRANGITPPPGYTASMFNDMKALKDLTGKQQHEAGELIVQQHQAAEAARHNRVSEQNDAARTASEHEARMLAAGAPDKAAKAAQLSQVEAYNKALGAADELKKIVDEHGTVPLDPEARGRVAQLQHELATYAVQAKSKPGVVPRPNAVEEEMNVLPPIGTPAALLKSTGATKNLVDSFVRGLGTEAGAPAPVPAGAVGGGWTPAKEARLQELRRKKAGG